MRRKRCVRLFLCVFACALLGGPAGAVVEVEYPIAYGGKPVVDVIVGEDHPVLDAAIQDLVTYVERISGAKLEVKRGKKDLRGSTLHLGRTELFDRISRQLSQVKVDGFVMAEIGQDLIIAGNFPEGTANGITTVLREQFGVRWYYAEPLFEIVPEKDNLRIRFEPSDPESDVRSIVINPSYLGRTLWGRARTEDFGRRMRLTQKGVPLPYVGTGHSLSRAVPPGKYFESHPDYFALVDGRRSKDHPCFTHPDMFDLFMEYVRGGGVGFGVNDNTTVCQCDRCLAVDGDSERYHGMRNVSESYCQLIHRVAEQTAKESPDRRLGIFAYQITNRPPKTVDHLGENVDVVLCQDTAQYFDPEYKAADQEMSAEWCRKAGGVRMYDYYGISYWTPRYLPDILDDQVKHLHKVGVLGYGTHSRTMIDSAMPMFYLYYQLLWNVDLEAEEVIDTMLSDLYGDAAGPVAAWYDHWEDCWMRQTKTKWFYGMDDFFGEMRIYTREDIERGRELLEEAAALAEKEQEEQAVHERIQFLRDRYAYTYAAAQAYFTAWNAIHSEPESVEKAMEMSDAAAQAWEEFARIAKDKEKLSGTTPGGWWDKTFRVRMWGLKQMMRDAVVAPVVRAVVDAEGEMDLEDLGALEAEYAERVTRNRERVEVLITEDIGSEPRTPRASGLRVAEIPRARKPPLQEKYRDVWEEIPEINAEPWLFEERPENPEMGKYDEPIKRFEVDAPDPEDQSVTWQAAWDKRNLYIRIVVTDDQHVQKHSPSSMWRGDSVQIALNPERDNFEYDMHSWLYIWGGYRGSEAEFGLSSRDGEVQKHVWQKPESLRTDEPEKLIEARVEREGNRTIYEAAIDWDLIPDFRRRDETSVGISIVVNDRDDGVRRSALYGGGVIHDKRPTEFAALRLGR